MPDIFCKPAISLDEQITLLKSRGLLIADEAQAKHYLRHIFSSWLHAVSYTRNLVQPRIAERSPARTS